MNPSLAGHRGDAGTRLQRCRYEPLLLLGAPAAATLHRGNDFNRGLAHVTIPSNSHMTHILIRQALIGNYREEHLFALAQAVELYEVYQAKVAHVTRRSKVSPNG
jgi:hypothetical protein